MRGLILYKTFSPTLRGTAPGCSISAESFENTFLDKMQFFEKGDDVTVVPSMGCSTRFLLNLRSPYYGTHFFSFTSLLSKMSAVSERSLCFNTTMLISLLLLRCLIRTKVLVFVKFVVTHHLFFSPKATSSR